MSKATATMSKSLSRILTKMADRFPEERRAALLVAGVEMSDIIQNVHPKPPIDEGTLRASTQIYIDGQLVSGVVKDVSLSNTGGPGEVVVGLATPYAKYQHDLPKSTWTSANMTLRRWRPKWPLMTITQKYARKGADISEVGPGFVNPKVYNNRKRVNDAVKTKLAEIFRGLME